MEHKDYEELLTLHALDALQASDKRKLEEHLERCPECRTESVELRDTASLLAHASTPAEPRAEVRERILNQARSGAGQRQSAGETSAKMAPFRPRAAPRAWPNIMRLAAALAFVALLVGVAVLWQGNVRSRQELSRLSQQLNQQSDELSRDRAALARQREAIAFLNSPGIKIVELAGTQTAKTARATFVYDQATGRAMLMTDGLPVAPPGMAYEVWFIPRGQSPMPGKTFTVDAAGQATTMDQLPAEARENPTIAVTLEPKSGSPSPTGAIYLSSPTS